ncbi:MAG: hypothetical protein L6Q37_06685 [Bdellovibrionaceae bacterium]|nr:hypothetical protein [Pseudobdellovibrionaceae bacterium]NUM57279.1 hypothetical protein [Pseudobdellovibrionaceae bacterium]
MKTQILVLKLTLILSALLFITACGSSKNMTDDYATSSRLNTSTITSTQTDSSRPLAYCNQRSNDQLGVATAYYKSGEVIATNRIYLKITKIPSYFSESKNYIEFHKWMMNSAGAKVWGSEKMYFHIYSIATGELLSENKTYLYWADLQKEAQSVGAATPDQFFKKVRLLIELEDYAGEYDVITTKYFNSNDNSQLSSLDSLIPVFDADPTKYAYEKDGSTRNSTLQALHPFASYTNQGWTSATYQAKANEFCNVLNKAQ